MQKDRKLEIQFLKGVGPKRAQLLESELGAGTVSELIRVYPYKYVDRSVIVPIAGVPVTSASVQVMGMVVSCTLLDKSGKAVDIDSPVEMLGKIAGATDEKVSAVLQKALEKKGVKFRLSSKVKEITENGAVVETENGEEEILADKILLSVGRRANVTGFGLENIGVETERGAIVTDSRLKTNVENVYAAGDVNGKSMLAHTAYREGEVAVNNMLNVPDEMNYDSIPSVIYTTPEVASAGYTLSTAIEKGINADEVQLSLMYSGRYIAENTDYTGILKLVYDKDNNVLIGASVVGNYASEYIVAVSNLIDMKVDIDRAKKLVFPHPTVCEVVREGLFEIK